MTTSNSAVKICTKCNGSKIQWAAAFDPPDPCERCDGYGIEPFDPPDIPSFWHEWRGSIDGRPTMLIRHLISFRGYRLDLHKFIRRDDAMCFHTHPSTAIRIILWGGYVEERYELKDNDAIDFRRWTPGNIGIVRPELCHRIHRLLRKRGSYSLWFRFPKTHKIEIKGDC